MALPDLNPEGFCRGAAIRTAALQQAICDHPFNQALTDGSLDARRFGFYLVQDTRYLVAFARPLALAAAQAPDHEAAAFFALTSHGVLMEALDLHDGELRRLGWGAEQVAAVETSPTCLAYTSFLAAVALSEPWPVLVAALLPCFSVYHQVGLDIAGRTPDVLGHPYAAWIATYSDPAFGVTVTRMRELADRAAADASRAIVERMHAAFSRATEYEWMFWDSAWQLETWPTAAWLPGA